MMTLNEQLERNRAVMQRHEVNLAESYLRVMNVLNKYKDRARQRDTAGADAALHEQHRTWRALVWNVAAFYQGRPYRVSTVDWAVGEVPYAEQYALLDGQLRRVRRRQRALSMQIGPGTVDAAAQLKAVDNTVEALCLAQRALELAHEGCTIGRDESGKKRVMSAQAIDNGSTSGLEKLDT